MKSSNKRYLDKLIGIGSRSTGVSKKAAIVFCAPLANILGDPLEVLGVQQKGCNIIPTGAEKFLDVDRSAQVSG